MKEIALTPKHFTASMEAVQTFWNFVLLFSTIVFPQLIGVLLFFLLKHRPQFSCACSELFAPILLSDPLPMDDFHLPVLLASS